MRVLIIGKYPPIEGGVSSHTYWLARGLGEAGHSVSVVTNAGRVEEEYRILMHEHDHAGQAEYQTKNVSIFSLHRDPPPHIPYSEGYVTRLVNLGLRAIEKNGADVIYAHYLEPYGVVGLLLKELTGLPLVVRHAGSDIYRLLQNNEYSYVLGRVLQHADVALMSRSIADVAHSLGIPKRRLRTIPGRSRHPAFSPEGAPFEFPKERQSREGVPLITYLGKASPRKGIMELLSVVAECKKDIRLLFVSKGPLLAKVKEKIATDKRLQERVWLSDFIPPWQVPPLLRSSDMLVQLENRFPIPIHSPGQPFEAISCATPLLLSEEMYKKIERAFPHGREQFSIVPDPEKVEELGRVLDTALADMPRVKKAAIAANAELEARDDWEEYISAHVGFLKDAIRNRSLVGRLFPFRR